MSATLCNADAVAQWLGAALYVTDWRPIPLQQMLKVGNQLLDVEGRVVRTLEVPPGWDKEEGLALLCKETVEVGAARAHTRRLVGQDTDCAWCVM
jgi:DNA polymerase theta